MDGLFYRWDKWRALSWQRKTVVIGLVSLFFAVIIPLMSYAYYARDISDKERLINRKNTGVVLLDRNDEEFYSYNNGREQGDLTPLSEISDVTEQALIASEDQNFYEHDGFSFRSIAAAAYANFSSKDLTAYGGSTITQQLVKNSLFGNEKSFLRKYQELFLAIAVDRQYEKDEILEMYMNSVYFGEGAFGVSAAAQTYFNKPAAELNLEESALLVGLLPAPSAYSPVTGSEEKANQRQAFVLNRMVEEGFIQEGEALAAAEAPLNIDYQPPQTNNQAFHFALEVLSELEDRYGEEEILRSGYVVKTTLDLNKQREAETVVSDQIASLSYANASNGAALAIDPKTGEVLVMVGSYDFTDENFGTVNMTTTPRQPGSSFKPVYYSEAFDEKVVTPATLLRDEPTEFGGGYSPENYDFRYRGDIRVRNALATSLNIPAVKVLEQLGVSEAVDAARRMGLETIEQENDYGLAFALGVAEVPLIDLTNVYAAFANGGEQFEPTLIKSIDTKFRRTIFSANQKSDRVLGEQAAFLISSVLSDESARVPTFGYRFSIGRTMAVKTGTTQDSRDAWTMTYTPDLALGVWVGNNDNSPMSGIGGSSAAGPINVKLMQSFLSDTPDTEFEQPAGILVLEVCPGEFKIASGSVPGAYTDYFIATTQPDEKCFAPAKPELAPEPPQQEESEEPIEEDTDTEVTEPEAPIDEAPTDPVVEDPLDPDPEGGGGTDPVDLNDPVAP